MPTKKISTKRNVFLQLIILRPHPHFARHVRKKIRKTIRILHFWKSAGPQIRKSAFLPKALSYCWILVYYARKVVVSVFTFFADRNQWS